MLLTTKTTSVKTKHYSDSTKLLLLLSFGVYGSYLVVMLTCFQSMQNESIDWLGKCVSLIIRFLEPYFTTILNIYGRLHKTSYLGL